MSRRLIAVLTIVCATALSASAVAVAHGGHGGRHHRHAQAAGPWGASLNGVAQRLGVSSDDLRAAVEAVAAEQRAARRSGATEPDLATLKAAWINGLASKLGKTPDEVSAAIRGALEDRLTKAVARGWITEQGKALALGCFDDPASCDMAALRAEVRMSSRDDDRRHGRGHHGCKHHEGDGTARPGGRQTSAPLT